MCGKEEWKMRKMSLEDFVKYAKEEFDCDIICNFDDEPDTFEKIFGTSFLANDEDENQLFPDNEALEYDNVRPDILFRNEEEDDTYENDECFNLGLAA